MFALTDLIPPFLCAAIGYSTNWLAIKMLFRPHTAKRVFGIRLPFTPGLIPKERERLNDSISNALSTNILTPEVLARELASADNWLKNEGMAPLLDMTVGECLARLGLTDPVSRALEFANDRIAELKPWLAEKLFAEGVSLGNMVPAQAVEMLRKAAAKQLPHIIGYIKKWPEDNPWLDDKLSALIKEIIETNFGKLVGIFVDHKKIYAKTKRGLFEYLDDAENRDFMLLKINEAIDRLLAAELKQWESYWPKTGKSEGSFPGDIPPLLDFISDAVARYYDRLAATQLRGIANHLTHSPEKKANMEKIIKNAASFITEHLQIDRMVRDRLNTFTTAEAENLILSVINRELQIIMALGGVLGFIIGFVQPLFRWIFG